MTTVLPVYLIVVAAALGQANAGAAPLAGLSVLEPMRAGGAVEMLPDGEIVDELSGPRLVVTETPELDWLASWQDGYLKLVSDEGLAAAGFYDPFSTQFAYGSAGVQPYRLGWYSYNDYVSMTNSPTSVGGNFRDQQWNAWVRYAWLNKNQTVFTWTGWGNGKFWAGPTGIALPPTAIQLISDFQLASAYGGAWNWQVGFAPQLNGSWEGNWNSHALMFDGRSVVFYRASPQWMLAVGTAFWNRAIDRLIPYGGVIWAPDERWELRFMFPKSRASYYVGRLAGADAWLYASGEYAVEAYQVDIEQPRSTNRGEISDYRVMLGASATTGIWTLFLEGGVVTGRHFRFQGPADDFVMDDCGVVRTGLLF